MIDKLPAVVRKALDALNNVPMDGTLSYKADARCIAVGSAPRRAPAHTFSTGAEMIKTNDLKKGTRIKLANGWYGTLTDSKKGNIREAEVEGLYTEIGSVYAHDIVKARVDITENNPSNDQEPLKARYEWVAVEHTPAQIKARKLNADVFGDLGVVHYNDQTEAGL